MYINKLNELIKEFNEYDYFDNEELDEDITKIKYILNILERKGVCINILNFEDNE